MSTSDTDPADLLRVVVFGIINAGKSSLINALAGRVERPVGPIGGTTATVDAVAWHEADALIPATLPGARVVLVDTPGLEEVGLDGAGRGDLAVEAAEGADLVLFVLAEDLTATAHAALVTLRAAGRPMVVAVNKVDLLDDEERSNVVGAIRAGLADLIPPDDVIAVAASPVVRRPVRDDSGRLLRVEVVRGEADILPLVDRLRAILRESSGDLRALRDARLAVDRHVAGRLDDQARRRGVAERVADETSLGLAIALAANPVPMVDLFTGSAGLVLLVRRVAACYNEAIDAAAARKLAADLVRGGRVRLWGSLAATVAGGAMKLLPGLGHLAGAVTQGASGGYFVHVAGRALVGYFERGRDWGDGGLVAELDRVAAATDRRAVTRGLADQIRARLAGRDRAGR